MFRFTQEQLERIGQAGDASRLHRVLFAAAQRWHEPLDAVLAAYGPSVARGLELGFVGDADLSSFLDLVRDCGSDVECQPWAAPFFTKLPVDHPAGTLRYLKAFAAQRSANG